MLLSFIQEVKSIGLKGILIILASGAIFGYLLLNHGDVNFAAGLPALDKMLAPLVELK